MRCVLGATCSRDVSLLGSLLVVLTALAGCLTSPIEEQRTQQYASMQQVVLLSIPEIESNLVQHQALCGNGRWMKPGREGEPRQMVWGEQVNARLFRVDGWIDFEPLGEGRTQVTAHMVPAVRSVVADYMDIIVTPGHCR